MLVATPRGRHAVSGGDIKGPRLPLLLEALQPRHQQPSLWLVAVAPCTLRMNPHLSALSRLSAPGYSGMPVSTSWPPPPPNCQNRCTAGWQDRGGSARGNECRRASRAGAGGSAGSRMKSGGGGSQAGGGVVQACLQAGSAAAPTQRAFSEHTGTAPAPLEACPARVPDMWVIWRSPPIPRAPTAHPRCTSSSWDGRGAQTTRHRVSPCPSPRPSLSGLSSAAVQSSDAMNGRPRRPGMLTG